MLRRAFTLVELLICVAVIAILIALLFPTLSSAIEQARRVRCQSNLRQLMQATLNYAVDNNQTLPFPNFLTQGFSNNDVPTHPGWLYQPPLLNPGAEGQVETGTLWPYLKNRNVYRCPMDDTPSAFGPAHAMTSYVINGAICGYALSFSPALKYTRFRQDAISFWESGEGEIGNPNPNAWNDGSAYPIDGLTSRHRHGGCLVSFDTHTEWMIAANYALECNRTPGRLWCDPSTSNGQ